MNVFPVFDFFGKENSYDINSIIFEIFFKDVTEDVGKSIKRNEKINKPTFVVYVKTDGISVERAEQLLHSTINVFSTENANMWFIPGTESKVECIWKGLEVEKSKNFSKMFEVLDDLIAKSKDRSEFVKLFRQLKLSQIF